jgi:hypothetical protein
MVLLAKFWAIEIKNVSSYYPNKFYYWILPLYIFIWLMSSFLMGTYEKPYKIAKIVKGVLVGTLVIAALYGFLPESLTFFKSPYPFRRSSCCCGNATYPILLSCLESTKKLLLN